MSHPARAPSLAGTRRSWPPSGASWQLFSQELTCHNVHDLAVDDKTERVYVATYGRGGLQGNLTDLNGDRSNPGVGLGCTNTDVVEGGVVNCIVTLSSSGDVSEWRTRPGGSNIDIDIDIDLPHRTRRDSTATERSPQQGRPPELDRAFQRNGIDLGPKPSISLADNADNATDWSTGPWEVIVPGCGEPPSFESWTATRSANRRTWRR